MANLILTKIIRYPALIFMRSFDTLIGAATSKKYVLEPEDFPFQKTLFDNRSVFLAEYNRLLQDKNTHNVKDFYRTASEEQAKHDDNWKAAPLLLFNYVFDKNAERCPETFRIISQLPGCCGIMYSVLGPGKHVPPHRGIYRGFYRCLFTLQMAKDGDCWLRVRDKKLFFREGESIVFDETAEHEVKNETSQPRVALYLDFYRKLPFPLNILNNWVYATLRKSPYVSGMMHEYQKIDNTTYSDFKQTAPMLT